jgi:glycosyltransferase involved in cell wall biosynthesis
MTTVDNRQTTSIKQKSKRLGYLSAAPRVSTSVEADASGPRAHVLGVIEAFEVLGWDVTPFIVGDRMPYGMINQSGKWLEQSPIVRFGADLLRLCMGFVNSIQCWRELCGRVDWVYERYAVLQTLGWIFQFGKVPWILETSGLFFYEAKTERKSIVLSGLARKLEIWAYRKCDVLVCVTDVLKDLIIETTGISPEKIIVVPNGVNVALFDPVKWKPKRVFDGPTLGFVSTLVRWHRLDILINALEELKLSGAKLNLVVVGDGPMMKTWEDLVLELGLSDQICFVGRVAWTDVPSYIAGFDIGYMGNSLMQVGGMYHSPLKLYEYMSMAKPVVASEYTDSKAIITHRKTGYLFTPGDLGDLKRVLLEALHDKERWQDMGHAARQKVLAQASWSARVEIMINGIRRILEKQSAYPTPWD